MKLMKRFLSVFLSCLLIAPSFCVRTRASEGVFRSGQTVEVTQLQRIANQGNGSFRVAGADSNGYCTENYKDFWQNNQTKQATITEWDNATLRKVLYYGPDAPGYTGPYYGSKGADLDYCTFACGYINSAANCRNKTKANAYISRVNSLPDPADLGYKAFRANITPDNYQDVVFLGRTERKGFLSAVKQSGSTDITDGNTCYRLEGAVYGVYTDPGCSSQAGTLTFNAAGTAGPIELEAGIYYVKEITPPMGYALSTEVTEVNVGENQTVSVTLTDIPQMGKIDILLKKQDKDTGKDTPQGQGTFKGAEYTVRFYAGLYDADPEKSGMEAERTWVFKTDEDGVLHYDAKYLAEGDPLYLSPEGIPAIPLGTLTIKETAAPEGYLPDEETYVRQIKADGTGNLVETYNHPTSPEEVIKGRISIIKHTDNGDTQIETPEKGAEFSIFIKKAGSYEKAGEDERDKLVTDKKGYAITKELPYGIYTVTQTKGLKGRKPVGDFDVLINENGETYSYILNDVLIKAQVIIVKKDAETGKVIELSGVGFKVRNKDTGEYVTQHVNYPSPMDIDTFYTDISGKLMLPEPLPYGEYEIIEQSAPYGYVLDKTPVSFTVDGSLEIVTVEKHDTAQKGIIRIQKTGEVFAGVRKDGELWKPVYANKGLAGAVFEVVAANDIATADGTLRYKKGQVVSAVTTGSDGTGQTVPLYLGSYEVREIQAPYGMVINTEVIPVLLEYAGQEVTLTDGRASFANKRQKAKVSLVKSLEKDDTFGIGKGEEITRVRFGLFAAKEMRAADGNVIPAGGMLSVSSCDLNGKIIFDADLPAGTEAYVKEVATDTHYIISDRIYPVNFSYAGQQKENVIIAVNEGAAIQNEIIRGNILGKKTDEDKKVLKGAVFGLFHEDENIFTENTALQISKSDEKGIFMFTDVPYGRWIVRELLAPEGYALSEQNYFVTVSEDGEEIQVLAENRFIRGTVLVTKTDGEKPDKKLTGAIFEIYLDSNGNKKYDAGEDKLAGKMKEQEPGIYKMEELKFGNYLLHEKKAPEGYLADDGYYPFSIKEDGETVAIENKKGAGFTNRAVYGELIITKKDVSEGRLLAGAGFRIRDEEGNVAAEGYTDENGILRFRLRYGKYTYEEFRAPDGYLADVTPHAFEVKEEGQVIRVEMLNEKQPGPKTGDEAEHGFWLPLSFLSGGIVSFLLCGKRRKRRKKKSA